MPTVLVTGANRGIGLEYVKQYANEGWRVVAAIRDPDHGIKELEAVARENRTDVSIEQVDVADRASVRALADRLQGTAIDVLINNAGLFQKHGREETGAVQPFGHLDYERWLRELEVNALGPAAMAEAFVDHVAASERKTIVNMSSGMGSIAGTDTGGAYYYRTSKAALNMLTRTLAADLKDRGIKVVSLDPGWVQTRMGGEGAVITPDESVEGLRKVIASLDDAMSGGFYSRSGEPRPF